MINPWRCCVVGGWLAALVLAGPVLAGGVGAIESTLAVPRVVSGAEGVSVYVLSPTQSFTAQDDLSGLPGRKAGPSSGV